MHRVVDKFRHAALTCGYTNVLDKPSTLTNATRARRIARALGGLLLGVLCVHLAVGPASAKPLLTYEQYALSKVQDHREFKCLLILWNKESHWNPKADNPHSSAFGIPQLLNLKETNPYKQIDRGLKYIVHRYNGMCDALNHHKRKGYY